MTHMKADTEKHVNLYRLIEKYKFHWIDKEL